MHHKTTHIFLFLLLLPLFMYGQTVDNILHMYSDGGDGSLSYSGADIITTEDGTSYFIDLVRNSKFICPSANISVVMTDKLTSVIVGKLNDKNQLIDITHFHFEVQGIPDIVYSAQYHLNMYKDILYFTINGKGVLYKDDVLISGSDMEKGVILGLDSELNISYQKDITSITAHPVDMAFYGDKMYIYGYYIADTMSINGERINRLNVGGWSTSGFLYGLDMKTDKVFMKKSMAGAGDFYNTNIEVDNIGNLYFGANQTYNVFFIDSLAIPSHQYASNGIVFKLDSMGRIIHYFSFVPQKRANSLVTSIRLSDNGYIYASGTTDLSFGQNGGPDVEIRREFAMFVTKLDTEFNTQWTRFVDTNGTGPFSQNGVNDMYDADFDIDRSGNAYLTFWHKNGVVDDKDGNTYPRGAYIVKYTSDGKLDKIMPRTEYFGNTLLKFAVRDVDNLLMCHEYEDTAVEFALFGIEGKGEDKVIYDIDLTGISDSDDVTSTNGISIFPNPSSSLSHDFLSIKMPEDHIGSSYEIYDMQGKLHGHGHIIDKQIDVSSLESKSGMFLVKIKSGDKEWYVKIIRL